MPSGVPTAIRWCRWMRNQEIRAIMVAMDYSKHKDRDPRQTVEAIRAKLDAMGIETELVWTSHQFDGTWSKLVCRV